MSPTDAYRRFLTSKAIGCAEWHDGVGYDLEAFAAMLPADRDAEANAARAQSHPDWRDLEVLAAHGGKEDIEHLRHLLTHASIETRAHALGELIEHGHTPGSVADQQLAHVIAAIDDDDGLTPALLLAQDHAGPITKLALLRGMLDKPAASLHFASALMDLASLSDDTAAFDPRFRPLLLRLLPDNAAADRTAALAEVCRLLRIDVRTIPAPDARDARAWAERQWPR